MIRKQSIDLYYVLYNFDGLNLACIEGKTKVRRIKKNI